MNRTYERHKKKSKQKYGDRGLDNPDSLEIVLPDYILPYVILDDVFNEQGRDLRIIAFCSEFSRTVLTEYRELSIDGTFMVLSMTL
jgi:hypothetical protein